MDTMTVTNDKLDTRSHLSDTSELNRKSNVVITYTIDNDETDKAVWEQNLCGWCSNVLIG